MRKLLSILLPLVVCLACNKVPSELVQPEEMAQLMADVHTAEAVIEMNRSDYQADSLKQAFKQSVYLRHGVTSEQVDSSLAWYGRNITRYMEVYDRTIEILEHRLIESGNRVAAEAALSMAGDSVDVWNGPAHIVVNDRLPSKTVTFNFARDFNWQRGDSYTWRAKFFNNGADQRWTLVAEYADGTVEFLTQSFNGDGWKELSLLTDSLADATRVYGFLSADNRHGTSLQLDSVELVRKRVNPATYSRRYMQRRISRVLPPVEIADEVVEENTEENESD